jgi:hypothetical protein
MPWIIAGLAGAAATAAAYVKGRFTAQEGITPTKVVIYGGAALMLYLVLKRNKLV